MKKPELVIDSTPENTFIAAHCSSCEDFRFRVEGNSPVNDTLARGIFDLHFTLIHMREDASQTATRIVKEATEDTTT